MNNLFLIQTIGHGKLNQKKRRLTNQVTPFPHSPQQHMIEDNYKAAARLIATTEEQTKLPVRIDWDDQLTFGAILRLSEVEWSKQLRISVNPKRKDIAWFSLGGHEMGDDHWQDEEKRSITVFVEADQKRGLLLLMNSSKDETIFTLPDNTWGEAFRCIFDASKEIASYEPAIAPPQAKIKVAQHSAQVWLVTRTR